ncbi:hypothetical protein BDQ12DRAFT_693335 [Crucibulum laeve]|uniref:Uncharacterized protein n=1 Tax=Crucibulum laeve TaxID=68775 RepID=A0A5C3LH11_9AGAR|nr:hypothetical protein BDQ12DRAFT_693335 [Crucibulum laeve]
MCLLASVSYPQSILLCFPLSASPGYVIPFIHVVCGQWGPVGGFFPTKSNVVLLKWCRRILLFISCLLLDLR